MNLYNPRKKNSFQMQFGFQSPSWKKCSVDSLELQEKTKKKKKSEVLCTK
jgi:hypothetical protein